MRKLVEKNLSSEPKEIRLVKMFKCLRYFWLSMIAILLSACFPAAELQLLVLGVIAGAKWIASGSSGKINIFVS